MILFTKTWSLVLGLKISKRIHYMALCLHVSASEHKDRFWHPLSEIFQLSESDVS